MNSGICVCVLLAAISSTCLGYPVTQPQGGVMPASTQTDPALPERTRQARSALLGDPLKALSGPRADESSRAGLSEMLAELLSRKGTSRRSFTASFKGSSPRTSHRIQDRDYLGWMDFGRRSAEEYEYSS